MSSNPYAAILWARRQRQIPNRVAKNVLIVLATYASAQGTGAWPSQEELAADTGFSARAVRMALAWLEAEGYLRRAERRRRNGSRASDEYVLALDRSDDNRNAVPVVSAPTTGTPRHPKRNPTTDQPARDSGLTTFDQPDYPPEEESSEPHGSGPGEPAPSRRILFSEGRPALVALGLDRKTAGDVIGRWLRDTEDDAPRVLGAIRSASEHRALAPIPFITAHLRQPRTDHARFDRQPALVRALDGLAERLRAVGEL